MPEKRVQFKPTPHVIYYPCQDPHMTENEDFSPDVSSSVSHQAPSPPPPQSPVKIMQKPRIQAMSPRTSRPQIPSLDFSQLCRFTHPTKSDLNSNRLPRPLSPPLLSIDTVHHTPLYYTALSTCYF
ncbi:hypothetical protein [Absidia glauca]|uniref:Uncharacterized protein n=1 Tax=Absidia glauca TaxID=4829 RepID=A0A163J8Y7_ABSGL|nr:hypothetical protein [Absidia glauca]